jgi:hypothetical protein
VVAGGDGARRRVDVPSEPRRLAGGAIVPSAPGVVAAIPDQCPIEGVAEYATRMPAGGRVAPVEASTDHIASFIAADSTRHGVAATLQSAIDWFGSQFRLHPTGRI